MNKQDLKNASGISSASITKLGKGANITTDVLLRICKALNCDISDIMELTQKKFRIGIYYTINKPTQLSILAG